MNTPLSHETIKGTKVRYEVTADGYFYARVDGEAIASGTELEKVQKSARARLRQATRKVISVPFITRDFKPAIAKGKHATNEDILVWIDDGSKRGHNTRYSYYRAQVLKPDLSQKQLDRLKKLFAHKAKVQELIQKWEERNTFNLNEAVNEALKALEEPEELEET